MQLYLQYFLLLAAALFCTGIYGLVTSRNAVRVLMSIELLLNAVNLNLMGFSNYLDPSEIKGQVFAVFVIAIALPNQPLAWRSSWRSIATATRSTWSSSTCSSGSLLNRIVRWF